MQYSAEHNVSAAHMHTAAADGAIRLPAGRPLASICCKLCRAALQVQLAINLAFLCSSWLTHLLFALPACLSACSPAHAAVGAGHRPIRIDYVWATHRPLAADLALTDTARGFSYSDHLGLAASLSLSSSGRSSGSSSARSRSKGRSRHGRLAGEAGGAAAEAGALLGTSVAEAAQRQPALFQHAMAACQRAAAAMAQGRQQFMLLACTLWAGREAAAHRATLLKEYNDAVRRARVVVENFYARLVSAHLYFWVCPFWLIPVYQPPCSIIPTWHVPRMLCNY